MHLSTYLVGPSAMDIDLDIRIRHLNRVKEKGKKKNIYIYIYIYGEVRLSMLNALRQVDNTKFI